MDDEIELGAGHGGDRGGGEDGDGVLRPRVVQIYARDRLTVLASLHESGALLIEGQDLGASRFFGDEVTEYEYGITIESQEVPRVVAALGGGAGTDVLDLLERTGEQIVRSGESKWLQEAGVQATFWSRTG